MHFAFIPYGKRSEVELLLRDMEAQKHKLRLSNERSEKDVWVQGHIRQMPLGIYEYIFPKESIDAVLWTLDAAEDNKYGLGDFKKWVLKFMLKCDKIPKFKRDQQYLWIKENVNIIPLGVRYDRDITDDKGEHEGWTHEAL